MDKAPSLVDFFAGRQIPAGAIALTGTVATSAQRSGYISAYEVLSAVDYAACLRHVGDKVEVIGCIIDVKENRARNGKPYVFINFGDWRGRIFKVAIWSEGLAALKTAPDSSWIGKWLSVVGLMEPPYVNPKFKYSHLSINVTATGQMTVIPETDAQWRLAGPGQGTPSFTTSSNQDALDKIKGRPPSSTVRPAPPVSTPPSTMSANQAAIDKIRSATRPAPTTSSPSVTPVRRPPNPSTPQQHTTSGRHTGSSPSPQPPREKGVVEKLFNWLFG